MRALIRTAVVAALLLAPALVALAPEASAANRVQVTNKDGDAVVDARYATTLTLRGSGFQSIKGGHGGIYVLFGTVSGDWRPSAHGTGRHLTVPDSQTRDNSGYARFIAFPGSDTAGSANGGTIRADGTWSTTITVPGGVFTTLDENQKKVTVDCRKVTCGVLTIGAHGVANRHNESFTPVRVGNLYPQGSAPTAQETAAAGTTAPTVADPAAGPQSSGAPASAGGPATLEVDRASAKPGHVLAFSASGLRPGSQVSATFEDGRAGAGPLTVGGNGQVAGLITLPRDLRTGTYQLRLVGDGDLPEVRFAVVAPQDRAAEDDDSPVGPIVFAAAGAAALLGAIAFAVMRRRRAR